MKKIFSPLIFVLFFYTLSAQTDTTIIDNNYQTEEPTQGTLLQNTINSLQWNGYFQTDNRLIFYKNNNKFSWEEYRLSLSPEFKASQNSAFKSEIWLRTINFPSVSNYKSLSDKNLIQKIDFDLREAYFDIYGFLLPDLDLRVGRQRIAWGTADKLNPTDNLNPYDLEDIWDFGRHLASNSIKLSYYWKDFTFSGVFIPTFSPSLAPDSSLVKAFMPDINFPSSVINNNSIIFLKYNNIIDSLILPEHSITNSVFGFRIERPIGLFNTSISYMYGRDILPTPFKTDIKPISLVGDTMKIDVKSQILYPRMRVLGFDLAGSLFNVGVWAEAAVFFPEKITNKTTMALMGIILMEMDSVTVDNKPYLKIVGGFDYTFKNSWYLNMQYLHGFIHEKSKDLNDYYVFALSCPLFNNKVKLSPLNSCVQINDYNDILNNYAFVYMPEISYSGIDNLQLALGVRLIEGSNNTVFGKLKNNDEVYIKFKYSF